MLKILNQGDDKHDVEDSSGTKIGWISCRSIGFRGFATEADAREAAVAAWRALDRVGHRTSLRLIDYGQCTTAPMNGSLTALRRSRACFVRSGGRMMAHSVSSWCCPRPPAKPSRLRRREALLPRRPRIARSLRVRRAQKRDRARKRLDARHPLPSRDRRSVQTLHCNGSIVPLFIVVWHHSISRRDP
jgi:hypothetical protein